MTARKTRLTFYAMTDLRDERVSMGRVLEILKEAGDRGITGPDIARHFTHDRLQRRMTIVNQILYRLLKHHRVVRGLKEPTVHYHNVPTYRWFITSAGVHYLAIGMDAGIRRQRREQAERQYAVEEAHRKLVSDALTEAYDKYDPETTDRCERDQVMRKLREQGCTLHDIGQVFGVTRERVRQILKGYRIATCRCPRCVKAAATAVVL